LQRIIGLHVAIAQIIGKKYHHIWPLCAGLPAATANQQAKEKSQRPGIGHPAHRSSSLTTAATYPGCVVRFRKELPQPHLTLHIRSSSPLIRSSIALPAAQAAKTASAFGRRTPHGWNAAARPV
jgi:hypothetical protein